MQTALRCSGLQQKLSLTETRRDAAAARTLRVMVVRVVVVCCWYYCFRFYFASVIA